MQTSYYNNPKIFELPNLVFISRTIMPWVKTKFDGHQYRRYLPLAPDWDTILGPYKNGLMSREKYEILYLEQLSKLNANKVVEDLGEDATLMCYEVPSDFCHRHLVAQWITDNTGIIIKEFIIDKVKTPVDEAFEF